MMKGQYPWHIGTQLIAQIQAKDVTSALRNAQILLRRIREQSTCQGFEEVKVRQYGILALATRSAYDGGANPDLLIELSIQIANNTIRAKTPTQLARVTSQAVRLLIELVPDKDIPAAKRLCDAINFICDHCNEEFTCDRVASAVGCSRSYLSALFSRMTGHTFKETVLKYRMEKAKYLLSQSDMKITNIAFEAGYHDPNYFGTTFKRITGVTPGRYRRKFSQRRPPVMTLGCRVGADDNF